MRSAASPPTLRADDGVALHVEADEHAGDGPSVVFVHGYGAALEEWDAQVEALRREAPSVRVVRFDQRGHGRSGWGDPRRATVQQLGRDLRRVVEQSGGPSGVVLVAHSMGGMAVLALAKSAPELFGTDVRGVALVSTSAGHVLEGLLSRRGVAEALRRTGAAAFLLHVLWRLRPAVDAVHPFRSGLARRALRRRLFGDDVSDAQLDGAQWSFASTQPTVLLAFAPALLQYSEQTAVDHLRAVPTVVVTGAQDATIPPVHSERLAAMLGHRCRLVRVPGAGHMVNVTHAEAVSGAVRDLLQRVAGGTFRSADTGTHPGS